MNVSEKGLEKINTFIHFDVELNLQGYVTSSQNGSVVYELFAICNHHGDLNRGHYTAFCKKGEKWLWFNDSQVSDKISFLATSEAYILFYKKRTNFNYSF